MKTNGSNIPFDKETVNELTSLVREKHPDAPCNSIEEILAALLPVIPEEIIENQTAVEAVHSALQTARKATTG